MKTGQYGPEKNGHYYIIQQASFLGKATVVGEINWGQEKSVRSWVAEMRRDDPEHAHEYAAVLVIDLADRPGCYTDDPDLFPPDPETPEMTKGPIQ